MHVRVLGAGAGGGYPQWNCNHPNSRRARSGDPAAKPRTQSSIALSADVLHPREGLRDSPIRAVVLTNADVDHIAGLLNLRESQPFRLYATERVLSVLGSNSVFNVLNPAFVTREAMALDEPLEE